MDSLIPLILIALLYILPELFKRGRNKKSEGEYEYPQFPDEVPQRVPQKQKKSPDYQPDLDLGYDYHIPLPKSAYEIKLSEPVKPAVSVGLGSASVNIPPKSSGVSPLQDIMSPKTITNGIVFSEIIMKPRAYRPLDRYYNPKQ